MKIRSMLFTEAELRAEGDTINSPITEFYHSVQLHIHGNPITNGGIRFEREPKIHVDNKQEAKKQMKQVGMKANYSNTNKQGRGE